ncbi:MAG: 2Fe-2S iron-sulfur cluster binding domain-containing protein, partial [Candidatus Methanomethylophilaceae archaeon]|nr:2Fe-2S iron-sulfur cluster binding domain-containing protein [Candidatus Methanomethylophilaceae archaeon]
MQHRVVFRPSGAEVSVERGTKVSEAAKLAGVEIATPCGGTGRCGRCTVLIEGDFGNRVLACVTEVDRD